MTRKHILHVIPQLHSGGAERTVLELARAIAARGDAVTIATQGGRMDEKAVLSGAAIVKLPMASRNLLTIGKNIRHLARLVTAQRIDLIHAHSRAPAWSAFFAARHTRVPLVTSYHGVYTENSRAKALYNSVMARGARVICHSRFTEGLVRARYPALHPDIRVISLGCEIDRFDRAQVAPARRRKLAKAWGLENIHVPLIVKVARLTALKGHDTVIDALHARAMRGQEFVALLIGSATRSTACEVRLRQKIKRLALGNKIRLVGDCEDVPAALSLADLAIIASTRPESFGLAAIEAQAASVPVIVTDLGAARETVKAAPLCREGSRTGWLVPPGNAAALAEAIDAALCLPPGERRAMGERARSFVSRHFPLPAMSTATLALYDELLD